jgi:hypothetical protein
MAEDGQVVVVCSSGRYWQAVSAAGGRRRRGSCSRMVGGSGKVTGKARPLPPHLQVWADARKRYRLSHAHVQMARELGLNPKKFGKLGQNRQEPWKAPLPQFIEHIYAKRFGRERPEVVVPVEERARQLEQKKAARKAAKAARAEQATQTSADAAAE